MDINLYKEAAADIAVNPELVQDTARKMRMVRQNKQPKMNRYATVSCLAVIIMGAILLSGVEPIASNIRSNSTLHTPPNSDGTMLPSDDEKNQNEGTAPEPKATIHPIEKYYTSFQASDDYSAKLKAPQMPLYYDELKQQSAMIILGTISDVGVYSRKDSPLNAELSLNLANYLYTVKVDKVLSGSMPETEGSFAVIGEKAIAHIKTREHEEEEIEWGFRPYSFRPEEAQSLEEGKQYILFLSEQDDTEVYGLSWDGFGVFPVNYINEQAAKHSLNELQKQYDYVDNTLRAPMEDNLLYRLFSLYVKEEFF